MFVDVGLDSVEDSGQLLSTVVVDDVEQTGGDRGVELGHQQHVFGH